MLFARTVTYGDRATATQQQRCSPRSIIAPDRHGSRLGEEYRADRPDLALWVHNTIQWMALRAFDAYGPAVSEEDKGRYLVEQLELARLLNVPVDEVPTTPASLDAYMTSMTPHLRTAPTRSGSSG